MQQAIEEALKADPNKVYPNPLVGCVIVKNDKIIGRGYHKKFATNHAEVNAIESLETPVKNADLYVTLEPCAMCAALIANARIRRIYFAASDPKSGGIQQGARVFDHKQTHHVPEIYSGIGEEKAVKLLRNFFATKRMKL